MQIPFVDLKKEYKLLKPEIDLVIKKVVSSQNFILGDFVSIFEKNISGYLGAKVLGCASGSDALLLSLMAIGISEGDEIITTPFTFFATAGAIARLGAKPVFVDIDEETYNIDASLIEKAITKKTKAIIPVHLFGQPCEMGKIIQIAHKHELPIIEDACQAIGAEFKGKKVGTLGDFGCFSFFPTKNLGGFGDGGAIVCKSKRGFDFIEKARVHGSKIKYCHDFIGINSRLDALQAAILDVKLKYVDEYNNKRIAISKKYSENLISTVSTPKILKNTKHAFHQYPILVKKRSKLLNYLQQRGVGAGIYYPLPLHLQKCFAYLGYKKGDFPMAEKISDMIISLPIFPNMNNEEVNYVIKSVKDFINKK